MTLSDATSKINLEDLLATALFSKLLKALLVVAHGGAKGVTRGQIHANIA